jgi:glutaredoxin
MHARAWLGCFACCGALLACRGQAGPAAGAQPSTSAAVTADLPPLALQDGTPNLLLTWVGDDGDFHVVESISAVPPERRQQVRVIVTDQPSGSGQAVYVADLNTKRGDGTYSVKTRLEALAPQQPGAAGAAPGPGSAGTPAPGSPATTGEVPGASAPAGAVTAIIYGADWCKPCHDAERYLKSLGVSVTKKNIEESRAAQAEMREKLVRVHRTGSGIPVIDVMGTIFVGYSPGPLKQAVDAARHATQRAG